MPHRIESPPAEDLPPAEGEEVLLAILSRNLEAVKTAFSQRLIRDFSKGCYAICISEAIRINDASILSYLLSEGIPFNDYQILWAAGMKSFGLLQAFLDNGWDINAPMDSCRPSLFSGVIHDIDITKWFLEHGADPNAKCDLDYTPLSFAVARAPLFVIKLLFQNGGSAQHGQLLHYAATRERSDYDKVFDFLFSQGADGINDLLHQHQPNNFEMWWVSGLGTPLHMAARKGLFGTVEYLLNHQADPNIENSRGQLAIELAIYEKHYKVVELLSAVGSDSLVA